MRRISTVAHQRQNFTYDYYREFVERLREAYEFTTFRQGKQIKRRMNKPLVIIRHDIDIELEAACRISSLEKSLGIHATYFFMVRCPLYNVFSREGSGQVKAILDDGHHLGLHFDCSLYEDITIDRLSGYTAREGSLLEDLFGHPVEAVSFHRPGPLELSGVTLEGWPNSYEKVFLEKFKYFSDSRGSWARGNPLDSEAFARRENLHILVHPVWWTQSPRTPYECLVSAVQQINSHAERYLSENCQAWNEGKGESTEA